MKHVELQRREIDPKAYLKRAACEDDFDDVVDSPVALHLDGDLVGFVEPAERSTARLREALQTIKYVTDYRTDGMLTTSRTFGSQARIPLRRDFCTVASMAREHPDGHDELTSWASHVSDRLAAMAPEIYRHQRDKLHDLVLPDWRFGETAFTSGIVNKNNALFYHRDGGNFPDTWNAMLTLANNIRGGELVLPEFRLAIRYTGAELSVFHAQKIIHGVMPIQLHGHDSYRYSVVYFCAQGLKNCLTPKEEVERIRRVKTEWAEKRRSVK